MDFFSKEKIKFIDIQMRNSTVAIITIVVFLIISYNKKLSLMGEKPFIDTDKLSDIIVINRLVILVVTIVSVYLGYKAYEISKQIDNEQVARVAWMEYLISYLPLIEIIALVYISITYFDDIAGEDIGPIII